MSRRQISTGDELQFLVFRVNGREYAISIAQAERILRYDPALVVGGGPEFLAGTVEYAGARVPLLDLRRTTGVTPADREETRIMILALEGTALGIVVDQVTEVLRVDTRTILPGGEPALSLPAEAVTGTITRPGRSIVILNAARLLNGTQRMALSEART